MENEEKAKMLDSVLNKVTNNEALTQIEYLVFKEAKSKMDYLIDCLELEIEECNLEAKKLKKEYVSKYAKYPKVINNKKIEE